MSTQTSAMAYAKRRREEETSARADLKKLIPDEHFHADIEGNGDYNLSTKVMKAAEYYFQALGVDEGDKGKGKAKTKVVKLRYGKGKRKAAAEEADDEVEEGGRAVAGTREERTASGEARHSDTVCCSLLDCLITFPFLLSYPLSISYYQQPK